MRVARIQAEGEVMAEVAQDRDSIHVVLHPKQDGSPWTVSCNQLEDLLRQAKLRLVRAQIQYERGRPNTCSATYDSMRLVEIGAT